ncbi:endonuclease III [Candidatus Nitromaritima sp. SCGC AAA799-C22]|nr:endonuclease III [Candidatus Nitromaritima sp. SCGC AAA799-C22]
MNPADLPTALRRIRKAVKAWRTPVVTEISRRRDPFRVLVSCLLSLRTRDEVTESASARLFSLADTPRKILRLEPAQVEQSICPVAFYRNKTRTLFELCKSLIDRHEGKVPATLQDLLKLKGVGRKTANLTLILGHGKAGICVDTHVHRISNRWGYVKTKTPDDTETALRRKLPKRYWMEYNDLLVTYGQNLCKPVSPLCSQCSIAEYCRKAGVKRHR